ncbi:MULTISPECIES: NAD(P)/FAD-dependent oxidoreductase [unclassified Exiguobacterium]|uniref:dihydrolipoyl dehydrogenase family protein n=1 Tax=unclassified Exiguobacterium TaxID=2644629 RepID=UPI00103A0553|nr:MULTISPECIES: NAD(P)/FAD-dependent oxidoreductase [unclassified Exiguobacterium]TCI37612.1 NAD(P)/FAD-dependent oxidoreductase [Exiguobacterium sp. SH4S7]TCI65720.1 NAD(P)/FAD-dependent oxidoreductase [Exiguobacterium sp. SH0S2]TCI79863.1 NAD(P)/FAD-dependent oxidoreductase [Exiguobacterium sp. SH0S1]
MKRYDVIIIGSGSAASQAASVLRDAGKRIAIVENWTFGGTCPQRGCDPKKMLAEGAELIAKVERMKPLGVKGDITLDWHAFKRRVDEYRFAIPTTKMHKWKEDDIDLYEGEPHFIDEDSIVIEGHEISAHQFLIATGQLPRPLDIPGGEDAITSDDVFDLEDVPERITIVGAGYIAFEFAHILRRFGSAVTLLIRSRALKQFDRKIVKRLIDETVHIGIDVRFGLEPVKLDGNILTLSDDSTLEGLVLNATGRIPSIERLRLDAAGIEADKDGITVNDYLQTTNANVYAAGDVAKSPNPALTPFAGQEGRIAALNLLRNNTRPLPERPAPTVVFTTPPIAKVGLTVDEAKSLGIDYECRDNDMSHFLTYERVNDATAFSRVLLSKDGRVIGAHLIGQHAPELINLFSFIIQNNISHQHVKHLEFAYPTSASDLTHLM